MKVIRRSVRACLVAAGLTLALAASTAPTLADSAPSVTPTATPAPLLQRGATVRGTLTNPGGTGSAVTSFTIRGDGNSVTLTATFTGVDPNNASAFLTVWGPSGSVASVHPYSGSASVTFGSSLGTTYTAVIGVYPPITETTFTMSNLLPPTTTSQPSPSPTAASGSTSTPNPPNSAIPVITSLSASSAKAGDLLAVNGTNFGATRGSGYLQFGDNGVSWGAPGNQAQFQIMTWSENQIAFVVPTADPTAPNGWAVTPGTNAIITVVSASGLVSTQVMLPITTGVRWPVKADTGITQVERVKMQTQIRIDDNGTLTGNTHVINRENIMGTHECVGVTLQDIGGAFIVRFAHGPLTVGGNQELDFPWTDPVTNQQMAELFSVSVANFRCPDSVATGAQNVLDWFTTNVPKIADTVTSVTKIVGAFSA